MKLYDSNTNEREYNGKGFLGFKLLTKIRHKSHDMFRIGFSISSRFNNYHADARTIKPIEKNVLTISLGYLIYTIQLPFYWIKPDSKANIISVTTKITKEGVIHNENNIIYDDVVYSIHTNSDAIYKIANLTIQKKINNRGAIAYYKLFRFPWTIENIVRSRLLDGGSEEVFKTVLGIDNSLIEHIALKQKMYNVFEFFDNVNNRMVVAKAYTVQNVISFGGKYGHWFIKWFMPDKIIYRIHLMYGKEIGEIHPFYGGVVGDSFVVSKLSPDNQHIYDYLKDKFNITDIKEIQ